ncbi:MAG: S26 family signal peptidase [Bacteroidaceae bacterium]|nr:S26 family signal peptidase [Bacteroidaceae bacterium]
MKKINASRFDIIKCTIALVLYFAFLLWVKSWWGLLVVPFIVDFYITKKINWGWWKELENPLSRMVMSWVDAIVFALVAIYFLNNFFFQNFVIPTSSLEKTMLVGDYLCVSKMSYGPRIPQTPLTMPLTQNTMPAILGGGKSYLDKPHWEYRRIAGLGQVKLGDIVVFNYPAGDTVCVKAQNPDYRTLCYMFGLQILAQSGTDFTPAPSMTYEQQQAVYAQWYALGRQYLHAHPNEFGEVLARPVDRRENFVKRCVGMPGQTLRIVEGQIYLDGALQPLPEHAQFNYDVEFKKSLTLETMSELGITREDIYCYNSGNGLPLTKAVKQTLEQTGVIAPNAPMTEPSSTALYPLNMAKDWTTANYGGEDGIWIPKRGETRQLTLETLPIYEPCIAIHEGNDLKVSDGKIFINGKETTSYTFKFNYYWMMGDNRDCSADSRSWGFVPEDHIVGKPLFVWLSLDPDYDLFSGKIRWERFFKSEF